MTVDCKHRSFRHAPGQDDHPRCTDCRKILRYSSRGLVPHRWPMSWVRGLWAIIRWTY